MTATGRAQVILDSPVATQITFTESAPSPVQIVATGSDSATVPTTTTFVPTSTDGVTTIPAFNWTGEGTLQTAEIDGAFVVAPEMTSSSTGSTLTDVSVGETVTVSFHLPSDAALAHLVADLHITGYLGDGATASMTFLEEARANFQAGGGAALLRTSYSYTTPGAIDTIYTDDTGLFHNFGPEIPGNNSYTLQIYTDIRGPGCISVDPTVGIGADGFPFPLSVPEPSAFILCGLGALGLLAVARRRRDG